MLTYLSTSGPQRASVLVERFGVDGQLELGEPPFQLRVPLRQQRA